MDLHVLFESPTYETVLRNKHVPLSRKLDNLIISPTPRPANLQYVLEVTLLALETAAFISAKMQHEILFQLKIMSYKRFY